MRRLFFTLAGAMGFGVFAAPAHAVLIDFASGTTANDVDIVVSDLNGQIVSAFDILVQYDDTVLTVAGATIGDPSLGPDIDGHNVSYLDDLVLPGATIRGADFATSGEVSLFEVSLLSDAELLAQQPNSFVLATISFDQALATLDGLSFYWSVDEEIDVKGLRAQVIFPTTTVPEPAPLLLLAAGLLAGVAARRRFRIRSRD